MIDASLLRALPVQVTPLTMDDLDAVMALEPLCFALPWPRSAYRYELTQNPNGYYLALRPHPSLSTGNGPGPLPQLLAYGGFWKLYEEAHICTIASHPAYRGRGLGEWLLLHLLGLAQAVEAEIATLEVRVSNLAARHLYERTGFIQTGMRRHYYSDNGEDALIMTTPPLTSPSMQERLQERWEVVAAKLQRWQNELTALQSR